MTCVELRDIDQIFGRRPLLRSLNLRVPAGKYVVLLGPSGCGKTTLLRIIAGLQKPDRGSVYLDGQSVSHLAARHRDVSMTFQADALYPHFTVGQSLRFARAGKLDPDRLNARVAWAVELTQIDSILDRFPDRLSGGELRRAAIAKAITRGAAVRLLDEPLSALDISVRHSLQHDILRWHASDPGTTIHVTHDGQEAMRMADLVAVLDGGRIVQCASPQEIYDHPQTIAAAKAIGSPPINLFNASVVAGDLRSHHDNVQLFASTKVCESDDVIIGVRPERLKIVSSALDHAADQLSLVVTADNWTSRPIHETVHLSLNVGNDSITAVVPRAQMTSTEQLTLSALPSDLHCFDAKTGLRMRLESRKWNG